MKDQFARWFLGNDAASEFGTQVWEAMQHWDDVIDEGHTDKASSVFQFLAFRMDWQPFFHQYEPVLRPVMLDMFLSWRCANTLEAAGIDADLEKAFMLRAGVYRLYVVMAWLIGGDEHAEKVGPEIHRFYGERLADYLKEHRHA